jgi:hypothetical protein
MECIICFEEKPLELIVFFPCSHFVCMDCFQQLLYFQRRPICPICRNVIMSEVEPILHQETPIEPIHNRRIVLTFLLSIMMAGLIYGASRVF